MSADQLVGRDWEGGRRGFLGDTPANRELAEVMWQRPWDFGVVGSVVLSGRLVRWDPAGTRNRGIVQIVEPEVLDGVQRLGVLDQVVAEELPVEYLRRSTLRLEVVTGPAVNVVRGELDAEDRRRNVASARDELVRDPNLLRLMRQFRDDGLQFVVRRGEVREPYGESVSVEEATAALACLAPGARLAVAHGADSAEGRERLWAGRGGEEYRAVFNEFTTATGVQRAVEVARGVRNVLGRMGRGRGNRYGHAHLWRDAPQLVVWAVGRQLPVVELHREGQGWGGVDWDLLVQERLDGLAEGVAEGLRDAYARIRPTEGGSGGSGKKQLRYAVVRELGFWRELMEAYERGGRMVGSG
ncbi:hypothetical protein [Streptomyces sp. NPDC048442]|uniref:hypothetical protein n=1 Tax=Streptomyces sp. NPDC048442 TaxID=3154823 RepID=UPI00343DA5E0